jgi:hypothetical protein
MVGVIVKVGVGDTIGDCVHVSDVVKVGVSVKLVVCDTVNVGVGVTVEHASDICTVKAGKVMPLYVSVVLSTHEQLYAMPEYIIKYTGIL